MNRSIALISGLMFALAPAGLFAADPDDAPAPPAGWKQYVKEGAFSVFIPEKTNRTLEKERTSTMRGQRLKMNLLHVEVGPTTYQVERVILPAAMARGKRQEIEDMLKEHVISVTPGRVSDESEARLGSIVGKEFTVDAGNSVTKVRLFVSTGGRVYLFYISGSKAVVDRNGAIFLDSARLNTAAPKKDLPSVPDSAGSSITKTKVPATAKITEIVGGGDGDNEYKEGVPPGAVLVGFEVGLGKFGNNDVVRAFRAVYRDGEQESLGGQCGKDNSRVVKVIANPGYAVGTMNVKVGLTVDGMSITFMKVAADGKLDPTDSYESQWIGGPGGFKMVKLGNGTAPVGVLFRANDRDATGIALFLK